MGIILYLLLLRFQVEKLEFLMPKGIRNSTVISGGDLHRALKQITEDTQNLNRKFETQ